MSYKVKLQSFEGPFDLLVYLIENAEMSIYDIRISEITNQYLEYIKAMREHDINVATEFMVLASTLIEIKSKMILPRMSIEGQTAAEEDPRSDLVERILEYKRFKRAAQILQEREEQSQHIFEKPQEDISEYLENPDEYLSLDLKQFASAFSLFIQKKQRVEAVRAHYTRIERERSTMESRIRMILAKVRRKIGQVFSFKELIPNKKDRYDVVVTFMSLLEMAKERVLRVEQKSLYGDIKVSAGERVDEDTVLEKYSKDAEDGKEFDLSKEIQEA
ncbi:MAG: segregation/condensation protein A [Anaerovoracaceae bacterium]|nr:segregation/condensation protein A [Anaerovoracaceae bacterium]